jgi:hypothetical protein
MMSGYKADGEAINQKRAREEEAADQHHEGGVICTSTSMSSVRDTPAPSGATQKILGISYCMLCHLAVGT